MGEKLLKTLYFSGFRHNSGAFLRPFSLDLMGCYVQVERDEF
jgi:hypothetical protein